MRRQWTLTQGLSAFLAGWIAAAAPAAAWTAPGADAMPATAHARGKEIDLKNARNPFDGDAANQKKHIKEGAAVYFKNCFLCHGDLLDGKGVFAASFFPPPANLKQSLLAKPPAYAYWRILKGGRGLPDAFAPWDSAMPAWENELSDDDIWKTVLFLYAAAGENIAAAAPSAGRGQELYAEKCAHCHGDTGNGKGLAAPYSSPPPRNLTKGHIKLRTTPFGQIPTDQDLFDAISNGMPGTTMPPWSHLAEADRWSLVAYVQTLSKKFEKFREKGKKHEIVEVPNPPAATPARIESGRLLFIKNCSGCHGLEGRSDGEATARIVNPQTGAIWPRNLSKPWTFRRGNEPRQIFLTLRTGLSDSAMPRFEPQTLTDDQIWDTAFYVRTLAVTQTPEVHRTLTAIKKTGPLPLDPQDPAWKALPAFYIPLGGQIMQPERAYYPTANNIWMRAAHNGEDIALHLSWDDPTADPALAGKAPVQESPPPPVADAPAEPAEDEKPEQKEQKSADSIAVQFPLPAPSGGKPYFLNGDTERPVNLWKWDSQPLQAQEITARGLNQWEQPAAAIESQALFRYGQYQVVLKRKLAAPPPGGAQLTPGAAIPIAINVWDGSAGESGSKRAVSSWFELSLEP